MQASDVSAPAPEVGRWRHQQAGLEFIEDLWRAGHPGGLLAYAMGTGKTKIAIDLIDRTGAQTALVACPMRVVEVWREQLEKHARFGYVAALLDDRAGSVRDKARVAGEKLALARARKLPCLIVINYASVWRAPFDRLALDRLWSLVIADECHALKTPSGKLSRFMGRLALRTPRRLGLSGTPIAHSPLDVWAQYRFLDRTIYQETFTEFKGAYAVWGGYDRRSVVAWQNMEDFRQRFFSIARRVTKEEALPDLPERLDQNLYTQLEARGAKHYRELEDSFLTWLGTTPRELLTVANAMVLLTRLQQLTGGTLKDDEKREHLVDASKQRLLEEFLEDLDASEAVVVFAYFHSDLDAVRRASCRTGRAYSELSGRANELGQWRAASGGVLGAQIVSAAEGIDLTHASLAVFYSTGFRLYTYLQARDRLHRPGQTRAVTYYHLIARGTVDEIVARAVQNRWELAETVLKEMTPHAERYVPEPR